MSMKAIKLAVASLLAAAVLVGGFVSEALAGQPPETEWTLDGKTLKSSGGWQFNNVTLSGSKITLSASMTVGTETSLDFNAPITDASGNSYVIINMDSFFTAANAKKLTDGIWLPESLESVGSYKTQNLTAPIYFPDVMENVKIASYGFYKSKISNKVTLGDQATAADAAFSQSTIPDVELGTSCAVGGLFAQCKSLTNFISHASELSIGGYKMQQCTALKEYHFACYPTLTANWNSGSKTGTGVRTFVPEKNDQWKAVIDGAKFKSWAECTESERSAYLTAFGEDADQPLGYTTSPYATWLLYELSQGGASLTIDASPKQYGTVEPGYGVLENVSEEIPCSVTESVALDAGRLFQAKGWTLDIWQDGWVQIDAGEGTSYVFTPSGLDGFRLSWQWEAVAYQVKVAGVPPEKSVTINTSPDFQDCFKPGSTFSATAIGDGFVRWVGAPDGVDASQRTISFTVSGATTIYPCYSTDWVYDGTYLSNGDWKFRVNLNGTRITINPNNVVVGVGKYLDFNRPVTDGAGTDYTIVDMGSYFNGANPSAALIGGIVLPATLETVGMYTMQNFTSPIYFPDVMENVAVSKNGFYKSRIASKVTLGDHASADEGAFTDTTIPDLEIGRNCTVGGLCADCSSLTNYVSHANELTMGTDTMKNCTALKEYRFACYPKFSTGWNKNSKTGTGVRIYVPRRDAEWKSVRKSAAFTKWAKCSEEQTKAYASVFGATAEIPWGYTTGPFGCWLLGQGEGWGLSVVVR